MLRLGVGRIGKPSVRGTDEFENVLVGRDELMKLFPAEAPKELSTLDGVLRAAANQNGGALTQANAEKIARAAGVFKNRDELRDALKRLKIQDKQGRKKIRQHLA